MVEWLELAVASLVAATNVMASLIFEIALLIEFFLAKESCMNVFFDIGVSGGKDCWGVKRSACDCLA